MKIKPDGAAIRANRESEAKEKLIKQRAHMEKVREKLNLKKAQKKIVQDKIAADMPITDQERELVAWVPGRKIHKISAADRENDLIAAASKLLIQPTHVKELRLLVESTAAKYQYNPIKELILMTQGSQIDPEDKISIHKALLPFLVPVLTVPKTAPAEDEGARGMKVVVTQFVFPESSATPIHMQVPTTVLTEPHEPVKVGL